MAFAIVQENQGSVAGGVHHKVKGSIAIQIGEYSTGRPLSGAGYAGFVSDIFKPKISEVSIQAVGAVACAEVEVTAAVPIDISGGYA
jgi:hypothetical protein